MESHPRAGSSDFFGRAVIYDLDATLVDSVTVAIKSFADAYRACGLPGVAPAQRFVDLSGTPLEEVCVELGLPARFAQEYRAAARRRQDELSLFPGIFELLALLRGRNVPQAIITGKDRPRTLETLHALKIGEFIDATVTPDDPPEPKPSPEGVYFLCDALEVSPGNALVVGDSPLDMACGKAAGACVIGCTWGISDHEELIRAGGQIIVDSVDALSRCLMQLCQLT